MGFRKIVSFQPDYVPQYHITKYISERTKLQLVHINHKTSTLVHGYFAVPTECPNDSGAPHTLEHLIFMGSKSYPYKGLLDTAGNLSMSITNAWTDTDQTVYTLASAGWKGFSKLLPTYLDHILHPTLTDEACLTEVYHIDPENLSDKGVVFSEMEAIETQSWYVSALEKQRLMFPEGSGYRSETGGLTKNLRTLTNEEIRKFHESLYSSDNLCIIVCGNVPTDELLTVMEKWEDTLPEIPSDVPKKRPFLDTKLSHIPQFRDKVTESTVEFPELDESQSDLFFSWIGMPYTDFRSDLAVSVLLDYFTESALAIFTRELVEIDDPMANSTEYWTDDFMRTIINLRIQGVPSEKVIVTKNKVLEILKNHKIDLPRVKQVVENTKWEYLLNNEKNGESALSTAVITDYIYGHEDGSSLVSSLENLSDFDSLSQWPQQKWESLLKKIFVDNKPIIVTAKPSAQMYERIETERLNLIKQREVEFDENRRLELLTKLNDAKNINDKPIPKSLLQKFEIHNPSKSVQFVNTKSIAIVNSYKNNDLNDPMTKEILEKRPNNFPFFIHLNHFPSQFIELHCLVNSTSIKDTSLLPYYNLFDELFSMPMKIFDQENNVETILSYEEVVAKLKSETVDAQISQGLQGSCPDLIDFRIQCKAGGYSQSVQWIKHCLFDIVFDEKRVRILLENYLNSIVEWKREGSVMLDSLTNRNLYSARSLKKSTDPLFVETKLQEILEEIENGNFEKEILPRIEIMRRQLRSNFNKFHILVLGDISKITDIYEPWNPLIKSLNIEHPVEKVKIPPAPRALSSISSICERPSERAFIITTPASESAYMNLITSIPFNLDYHDPEYAIVSLASEYLQCVEGPFWKGIRGAGLAYGAGMLKLCEINSWGFNIYRGADVIKCYEAGKQIVQDYASGALKFDEQLIQGAISSIINRMATIECGYFETALSRYTDEFCLQRGNDFNELYLERLQNVSEKDLQNVMQKYFVNMFNPAKSVAFVACHPGKLESVQAFLETQGFTVEIEELEDDEEEEVESDKDKNS
ncbi:YOL098C-like protein [Saccharomyces kudriavzevii IFO 1802]|uniref:YOL098C-like protein n=1 Tax=Saccharomyces kudriavzevii (strain ATCC MYA-4449 / AS 2.2408 / CBS 8840 / NBRC 1802 / NCYC 2889) TaxID=226230 RepID=J4TUL0_SACK1|nr:YOL098C-like protein [Saccharomyces kudriavzevii IFO 1802]